MKIVLSAMEIQRRVRELGDQISEHYRGRPLTVVGLLTGCLPFLADLVRHLDVQLRIELIRTSTYRGAVTEPGELVIESSPTLNVAGREVLLVDDIFGTGQTMSRLIPLVRDLGAQSVRVAVLLVKKGKGKVPLVPDYYGFEVPDTFMVGYGLDFDNEFRHLPCVMVLPEDRKWPGKAHT